MWDKTHPAPPLSTTERQTDSVVRMKLLDGASVSTESPPSQHEQVFGLSQVEASVAEELQDGAKRDSNSLNSIKCLHFFLRCVYVLVTWCRSRGRLSAVCSKPRQTSSSLRMTSACDCTGKAAATWEPSGSVSLSISGSDFPQNGWDPPAVPSSAPAPARPGRNTHSLEVK